MLRVHFIVLAWTFAWVNINPVSNVELIIVFEFDPKFAGPFGLEQSLTKNSIPRMSPSQAYFQTLVLTEHERLQQLSNDYFVYAL